MTTNPYTHSAGVVRDDGSEIKFHWHWPRGTFDRRMSALELAQFILPHMPAIVPLLGDHPRVQAEFEAMLVRLATWPQEALCELATWIKPVVRTEEDDLIVLSLFDRSPQPTGPTYFV